MSDRRFVVRTWLERPRARVRLLCFPWAGASALAFRPWAITMPDDVEVATIEYPGRGAREASPCRASVEALVDDLDDLDDLVPRRPYAVLGYSLGALVAYEWLRRAATPAPVGLFVCSRRAPHRPNPRAPIHALPHDELVEIVRARFAGIPDILLEERELLERFLVPLRADLRAVEEYVPSPAPPLSCPLIAVRGARDPDVGEDELEAWASCTTGPFRAESIDAGHFFLEHPSFRATVLAELARW